MERTRVIAARIKDLKARLVEAERERRVGDAGHAARGALEAVLELSRRIADLRGGDLIALRTRLAQSLRLALDRIEFDSVKVVAHYRTAMANSPIRRAKAPDRPLSPVSVTLIDEGPRWDPPDEDGRTVENMLVEPAAEETYSRGTFLKAQPAKGGRSKRSDAIARKPGSVRHRARKG